MKLASQKTYKFLMEIDGKMNGGFNSSVGGATGKMGKLGNVVGKFAKILPYAFAAKEVIEFGKACVKSAMEFEDSMADVSKVVDGLRDSNGNATKEYEKMSNALQEMSLKIPMTANELAKITASAAQAGIAKKDLLAFTESAAKMGVAFDISAEQAGEWMANWRTSMGLTQKQVENLADQVNYLGNTSSELPAKIGQVVGDVGALGKTAGLSGGQVAALAAATTGVDASTAGTGIKSLITTLTAGASATGKQSKAFQKLGLDSKAVASGMQKDSEGTILGVMKSLNKLPKSERLAVIKDLFGKQSLQTIAKFAGEDGLKNLQKQFKSAGDKSKYAGSMQKEYDIRSKTTSNSMKLLNNSMEYVKVTIGAGLLPMVAEGAKGLAFMFKIIAKGVKIFYSWLKTQGLNKKGLNEVKKAAKEFWKSAGPMLKALAKATLFVAKIFATHFVSRIKNALIVVYKFIKSSVDNIRQYFGGLIDFVAGVFTGNWGRAWRGVVSMFKAIFSQIANIAKLPINAVISLINSAIDAINSIHIKLPDKKWVPSFLRGAGIGFNIKHIPMLAEGGIVTKPTLAMIGEAGPEKVVPLKKDKPAMNVTFAPVININGSANQKDIKESLRISFEEFKKLMKQYEKENKRTRFA